MKVMLNLTSYLDRLSTKKLIFIYRFKVRTALSSLTISTDIHVESTVSEWIAFNVRFLKC